MLPTGSDHPTHGDVWQNTELRERFSVMHVCGHHEPPHVTGYWWTADNDGPHSDAHGSIPLPRFVAEFTLVEREEL